MNKESEISIYKPGIEPRYEPGTPPSITWEVQRTDGSVDAFDNADEALNLLQVQVDTFLAVWAALYGEAK